MSEQACSSRASIALQGERQSQAYKGIGSSPRNYIWAKKNFNFSPQRSAGIPRRTYLQTCTRRRLSQSPSILPRPRTTIRGAEDPDPHSKLGNTRTTHYQPARRDPNRQEMANALSLKDTLLLEWAKAAEAVHGMDVVQERMAELASTSLNEDDADALEEEVDGEEEPAEREQPARKKQRLDVRSMPASSDTHPGTKRKAKSGTPHQKEQEQDLKSVLQNVKQDIPMVFVSGNHDIGNTPTPDSIAAYRESWGDDYFSFWAGGVFFLVLNSQFFHDSSKCPELKEAHDTWLSTELDRAKGRKCKHAIIFQHIPLFLKDADEEDDYFNIQKHLRGELVEKFRDAGVKAVFSGHYHRNAGGVHKGLDMVVSSAIGCQLGEDDHGLRVVVVTADEIVHRYYSLSKLSSQGIDEDLQDLMKQN